MVVVILAGLVLVASGMALAMRTANALLNKNFNDYRDKAQDAAETGVNRIISELNKPANRGLLRSKGPMPEKGTSSSSPALWGSADVSLYRNRCPGIPEPSLAANSSLAANIGYPSQSTNPSSYNLVYIKPDGSISSSRDGADRAYQLLATTRYPEAPASGASILDASKKFGIFENSAKSEIVLVVEGYAFDASGNRQSTVVLRKSFELVPKCCGASFGGSHGNVKYNRTSDTDNFANPCLNLDAASPASTLGLGLLTGLNEASIGTVAMSGSNLITDGANPIPSIYCLATRDGKSCTTATTLVGPQTQLVSLNPRPSGIPSAPEFPQDSSRLNTTLTNLSPSAAAPFSTKLTSSAAFLRCRTTASPCMSAEINGDVRPPPDYCNVFPKPASSDGKPVPGEVLHCKVSAVNVTLNQSLYFVSGTRSIRFYLTGSSPLQMTGNAVIYHCGSSSLASCSPPDSAADLAFFGCNTCNGQSISLVGTTTISGAGRFFSYFPRGSVALAGNSYYNGILWTHSITSAGGVIWEIPGSGLAEVMYRMGMLPVAYNSSTDNYSSADKNPILYDYVARAAISFVWQSP